MPDRKSLTSVCAPKPTATPTIPALASSGPIGSPITSRTMRNATLRMTPVVTLRRTDDIVSARCLRRSDSSGLASRSLWPLPLASTPGTVPSAARWASRRISRCSRKRMRAATTKIVTMATGLASSQSADSASHL